MNGTSKIATIQLIGWKIGTVFKGVAPSRCTASFHRSHIMFLVVLIVLTAQAGAVGDLETGLLATVQAIVGPGAGDQEEFDGCSTHLRCASTELREVRDQLPLVSEPVRDQIESILARPLSLGFHQSGSYPLRVHWTASSTSEEAAAILGYIEQSWALQISAWGWPQPYSDEGQGGSDDYDVYAKVMQYSGYVWVENRVLGIDWIAYTSHMVVNPQAWDIENVCAHEFNHACQHSLDSVEDPGFFEQTASYMMYQVFPSSDHYGLVGFFQRQPYLSLDWYGSGAYYQYGSCIWQQFLSEYLLLNGPEFMRAVWQDSRQPVFENEPDYFDVLETRSADLGTSLGSWYHTFSQWRYFSGRNDDGAHFSDGGLWGIGGEVLIENSFSEYPVVAATPVFEHWPQEFGSSYFVFVPDGADGYRFDFIGDNSVNWAVSVLCIVADQTAANIVEPMTVDGAGSGTLTLETWARYDRLVLVVSNLGDGMHDPDHDDWTASQWSISVAAVDAQPIFSDGFESGDTSGWS